MNALSVKQLTKKYPNGVSALKGIDLEVAEGDFFALLGQNGAGKSTTIGIICSLVTKTSGKVLIFGHDTDKEPAQAKSLIGVVPQEMNFNLFETTSQILINQAGYYGIPKKIAMERMERYLKEMGLWEMHNQPAIRLSGGMKRRLMIARALMNEPKLLILDEPTAGVDIELRHTLWRFLTNLNQQGTTIILTTHYLEEAEQLCKNVAIIDHGEIIENANMKSLINRLNRQTLILDIEKPLWDMPALKDFHGRLVDETTMEIEIFRGQSINELINLLTQQNITISSLRNKTNRLEELFIYLISANKRS
ncbi:ABC transporter ATP-binding protein [Aquicella lusitana]|uniref:ABC-2 type transport system ATP-binding protein n=1 Tax=Aquicella lusitana TaxID=254246 RepID=A0A370GHC4_9COXI|nr:ABC transporter ATP-binding protein [Aquicella lusitana]RDI41323.1 ABC-2 type transport system ATP-binding protein [Aquicella lusitana]VVC72311.1 Daunorubicin/doxorubicin resistance ATP-binding protein DrrA [Aquicella lusitana]